MFTATMDIGRDASKENMPGNDFDLQDIGLEDQGQVSPDPRSSGDHESDHDQLPDVEEYKTSQQVGARKASLKVTLVIALSIVVASVLIAVGVVIGKNSKAPASKSAFAPDSPEPAPMSVTTTRADNFATLVTNMGWADAKAVQSSSSPQYMAVQWLANDDPKKMAVVVDEELMNRYLLVTLYYALDGDNWKYETNFLSDRSVCEWNSYFSSKTKIPVQVGVTCHKGDANDIAVNQIFLPSMGLKGSLPTELGLFFDLEDLNLFGNQITGGLPESMKNLKSLKTLVLHDNKISSPVPAWITRFKDLNTLNLAQNKFFGPLPSGMGTAFPVLLTITLEVNLLTGTLDELKGLSAVNALYLGNNTFSGELNDDVFDSWRNIEVLDISDNSLSGKLPSLLIASDSLLVVDLHGNHFSGELPFIVQVDASIKFLALHDNKLTGPIDERLISLTNLEHLDLSKNFFTGDMPSSFGEIKSLTYLFLAFNDQFNKGPIPVEYATLPNLVDLSLQQTNRDGKIPYQIEALSKLVLLDLNKNALTGTIPTEVGRMTKLKFLLLKDNKLSGSLPSTFKNLQELDTFLLDRNGITGGSLNVCEPKLPQLTTFIADCAEMIRCDCCTKCCATTDASCDVTTWFSDVDPIASGNYVRDKYVFHENDIVYPVAKQTADYYKNYTGYYLTPVPP